MKMKMPQGMNRRGFLRVSTMGSLLSTGVLGSPSDVPAISFPTAPRARLAVASYPFRKDLNARTGTMKLVDFPRLVVDRFQVNGVEPLDEHFDGTEEPYLGEFRKALEAAGAHVVNIPVGQLHGSFYDPDEGKRNKAVAAAKKWIDVAAVLGSPGIRVHVQSVPGLKPNAVLAAGSLAKVAEYGERRQIVVNLENDDPASEEAFYLIDILDRAQTPWLRALPDFCNSMLLNRGEAYNYRALTAMFRHACTISHVKEVETDDGKVFRVDVAKIFAIAKATGFKGYFSMEWDSEGDPYAGTTHLIAAALQALT